MKIQVFNPQGKKIEVEVSPGDTIEDVQNKVEQEAGLDKDTQRFTIHGDRNVFQEPMKIFVRDTKGWKFAIDNVDPLDTIGDIKQQVQVLQNIPVIEQYLLFGETPLNEDSHTLFDCGIKHKSILDLEPMTIFIKTTKGEIFELIVDPTDSVESIKKQINEAKGVPLDEIILTANGDALTDKAKLSDCGIRHRDTLDMNPLTILVKDATNNGKGKMYTFEYEATETIEDIKNTIVDVVGIPMHEQLLSFDGEMLLRNSKTLRECGLKHQSMLVLEQMKIRIKTFKGDKFKLDVEHSDTLQSIQERIQEKKGIPMKDQVLFLFDERLKDINMTLMDCGIQHNDKIDVEEHMKVNVKDDTKNGGGKTYLLYTEETFPISKIAEMIVEQVGIPRDDQILSFNDSLIFDKDMGTMLKDYGIKHKSTIRLVQMIVNITTFQGDTFDLSVEQTDTLQSIKDRVMEMKDIPLKDQILWYKDERKDDMNRTLLDCGIQHLDKLVIEEHMKVFVKDETKNGGGKVYTFYTQEPDPIEDIAAMIDDVVGIPREAQLLYYKDKLIEEAHICMPLNEYGILHKSTIYCIQMKIKVNTFQGDKFKMDVERTDTLRNIKERVMEKKGIPLKDQILFFKEERYDDTSLTLVECGIQHNDKVVIEEHMKVIVQDDTKNGGGKTYVFYTEETYSLSKIAEMIVEEVGIPRDDQILSYEDSLIFDKDMDSTLKNYGIKHKSTIHLVQMIVNVTTFQGDSFDLSVEQTDSLQSIKDKVLEMKGIPLKDQLLWFNDERLDDTTKILSDCGIEHLSKITIEEHMKVLVQNDTKNGGGKVYTFYTEETYLISKIAKMIEAEVGIPVDDQLLSYDESMISDEYMGMALKDYGIKHKSTIHAIQMQIKIKTFQGDKFKMAVEKTDKVEDIMNRIKETKEIPVKDQILWFGDERLIDKKKSLTDYGIQHEDKIVVEEHMKVTVQDDTNNGGGKQYLFYTEETFPLSKIAEMIADEVGIPEETQLLSYEESMIDSKDMGKTLKDYGIKHKSTIHAVQMMVAVETFNGDKLDLAVEQTDTLKSIQDRILDTTGIPLIDQVLFFEESRLDDMDQTLVGCGIHHLDKIIVEEHMKVNVQDDTKNGNGKVYTFYTDESMQISQIMDMIADEVGIPKRKQLLSYEERLVFDEEITKSLKDYGIKHQSTMYLVQMMITVKTFQGDTFMMTVDPNDKCKAIKNKVKDMKGIELSDQLLVYNDKRPRDMDSLKLVGIKHGDTVYINQAMKVNIQDDTRGANGKIYTFYMEETDIIYDVSMLIEKKVGIEKDKQRMTFNGENLVEEDKTLKDCGIGHDDTIHVKKSYIPVDWKKTVEEKYGKVKITTYEVDYTLDEGVIKGIKDEREEKIDITGRRRSQMIAAQKEFMGMNARQMSPTRSLSPTIREEEEVAPTTPKKSPKKRTGRSKSPRRSKSPPIGEGEEGKATKTRRKSKISKEKTGKKKKKKAVPPPPET